MLPTGCTPGCVPHNKGRAFVHELASKTVETNRTSGDARSSWSSASKRWSLEGNTCSIHLMFFHLKIINQRSRQWTASKKGIIYRYCYNMICFFKISNIWFWLKSQSIPKFNVCTAHLKVPHHHDTRALRNGTTDAQASLCWKDAIHKASSNVAKL